MKSITIRTDSDITTAARKRLIGRIKEIYPAAIVTIKDGTSERVLVDGFGDACDLVANEVRGMLWKSIRARDAQIE